MPYDEGRLIRVEEKFISLKEDMLEMRAEIHEMRADVKVLVAFKWKVYGMTALLSFVITSMAEIVARNILK